MKRRAIEFLWAWLDALRRRDVETMAAALAPDVVWKGIRDDLVCEGPDEVVAAFAAGYDADQEIDSLELLAGERHIVLGVRSADLGRIDDVEIGNEIYNVFTIEDDKIVRIEDYLRRDEALSAGGLV